MWKNSILPVFLLFIPLALILGYLLATPDDLTSFGIIGLVIFSLCIPIFLRWHHLFLILSWNAFIVPYFLPGRPDLWTLMAVLSLTISVLRRTFDKGATFIRTPNVTMPILFLGMVILTTAVMTGGGLSILGSKSFGGKKYFFLFAAIAGYFALTAQSIPKERAKLYTTLFFISGITAVVGNLAYMGGPSFYFLFALFSAQGAVVQASASEAVGDSVVRVAGLAAGCLAVYCTLLARNGIREIFHLGRPWRLILLILAAFASLLGGFRSAFVNLTLIFAVLFYVERLHRTRLLPILALGIFLLAAVALPFVQKLPYAVQRSLSILPIKIDPVARMDAEHSSEWRLQMWKIIAPQIPQYFFKGKGYNIDPTDLYMSEQLDRLGLADSNETAIIAGNYHSGPLTLMIPFGIFGFIGFVWFLAASLQTLYRNHRFGDPALQRINAFLLAFFAAKTIFFFGIYGDFSTDFFVFVGLIGLSISLNGRARESSILPEPQKGVEIAAPVAA